MFLESRVKEKDLQSAGSHLEDVRGLPGLLLQQSFTAFTAVITTAEYAYACLKGVSSVRLSVVISVNSCWPIPCCLDLLALLNVKSCHCGHATSRFSSWAVGFLEVPLGTVPEEIASVFSVYLNF